MSQLQVTFRAGTMAQYQALQTKDEGSLYFITDKNMIFRGNVNVTSRYLIGAVPAGSNPSGLACVRLTDQMTGQVYDIPLLSSVSGLLETNLVLRFHKDATVSQGRMLSQIDAEVGTPASGAVKAGTVFRVECEGTLSLNPGQFGKPDSLLVSNHDLIVALYDLEDGMVNSVAAWTENHQLFTVIPTDLVDLVVATNTLDNNKVILGSGNRGIKAMPFGTSGQVLRMNSGANGVEWVTPETVQNVVYWEGIADEEPNA